MPIVHKTGSLFDAPKGSMLIHAVSTRSVWGSGIALQFKAKFPESFEFYTEMCKQEGERLLGKFIEGRMENDYTVLNLVTSVDYGARKDSSAKILKSTRESLELFFKIHQTSGMHGELHSCKFNSGLFGVPWEKTEKVLLDVMNEMGYNTTWTVWSPKQGDLNA
jgi:ADP-ribose 1''-phosphate phosphatase